MAIWTLSKHSIQMVIHFFVNNLFESLFLTQNYCSLINTKLGDFVNLDAVLTMWINSSLSHNLQTRTVFLVCYFFALFTNNISLH